MQKAKPGNVFFNCYQEKDVWTTTVILFIESTIKALQMLQINAANFGTDLLPQTVRECKTLTVLFVMFFHNLAISLTFQA